jgi:pyruvate/2-oxoglutarate dehydrogenase complex dihydrolipoamide acyltransferase (E2) component
VRKLLAESGLDASQITGIGPHGMMVKGDVLASKIFALAKVPIAFSPTLSYENIPTSQIRKGWH